MKRENRVKRWLKHSVSGMIAGCLAISMVLASVPGILSQAEGVVVQEETRTFVHPGMLHTAESFAAMKENVENSIQPNLDTWNKLKSNGFSAADWQPRQLETVVRGGDGNNCAQFYIDIRRAYQTALVWKISGSEEHGEAACRILNAWSSTMKSLTGNADRFLAAGIYGYELANAAEIMRDHPSFDKASMEELLLNVFYPMNEDFLTNHNGAHIGNYWANWDLCNIAAMMSIGIFTDRADIYDRALTYYKTGLGNGSIYNAMPYVFEDGTVQWQESGRDQGHTTLGVSLCEVICEMAWNQGDDLYSLSDNRFLKAVEYIAKYNNGEDVQYAPYQWLKGQTGSSEWQNAVSEAARGSVRPVYSMVYNHYVNRMGLSAPNIEKVLKEEDGTWKIEAEQSNGDEFGWQTLTFANTGKQTTAKKIQGDFEDGKYRIRSVLTGKSIVVNEEGNLASADAGTRADEWWTLTNTGDGEYIVTNAVTGKVMQINSDYYTYASVIGTGTKDGGLNQKFAFVKNDTGDYRIIPTANFFVLDLMNAGTTDDTPIIQYRNYSSSGQKWIIESVEEVEGIDVLADFTFDDEETGFVSGYGIAKGSYTLKEQNGGNALYLNGSSDFLEVTMKDGKSLLTGVKEMTVSFMAKPEAGTTNWAFYAAPNAGAQEYLKENYVGILESNGTVTTERYKNMNSRPASAQTTVEEDGWYYLTVVYTETETIIYVNGEEKTRQASDYALTEILGDDSIVYIGKANWKNGEYYKGLIDNYSIRGRALSAEEVKEAYEEAKIPKVLAMFTFDDEESGFTNGYAVADGTYSLQEHDGGKALHLDGTSNYLDVKTLDGTSLLTRVKEMTVSFQAKPEAGRANWPFYAAPDANGQTNQKERYLGILEKDGTITAERYNNTNRRPSSAWTTTDAEDWYYVTVVQTEQESIIYIDGEEKARQSSAYALTDILGEDSILYIGKANWGNGEYYKGLIDNYTILSKALSATEVKELAAQAEEAPEGYLASQANSGQYMSVDGGVADENKGIIMWQGPEANQKWQFTSTGTTGEYVIKNISTAKVLAPMDTNAGSQLVQKTAVEDSDSQIWILEKTDTDGAYKIKNKATGLYVTAEAASNLKKVCQDTIADSSLQIWLTEADITAVEAAPIPKAEGEDHLASVADESQFLAVSGGSTAEDTQIMTWTGPEDNQKWKFQETEEGSKEYYLVNINSDRVISAQDMREGTKMVQKSIISGDDKQIWSFIKVREDVYKIKNKGTHLYLTADVSASGARVLQKNSMDSDLQLWKMNNGAEVNTITDTKDYAVKIWITDGVSVTSDVGAAVPEGESVTFTITERDGYKVENLKFFVNDVEQTITEKEDGVKTCTVANVTEDLTAKAKADATCLDGYVYIPENDYTGRNQCLSPRVVEGLDGTLYCTFENGIPSEIEEGEYSFPIYESKDKGETWKRVGEIVNDDTVHPDSYYKITKYTDTGAPKEAEEVTEDTEDAVRHSWSLQCCPQLFVLPEDQGELKAGTLVCAGVAVPLEDGAEKISDEGFGGLWDSSLDFYYSTDGGRSWEYLSTIAEGGENGRNIMGYDPVWEPYFVYYEGNLICYYSDETDPAHSQKLVYKMTKDGGKTWSAPVDVVAMDNANARPGMPVVTQLQNGKWMLVYETVGMTSPIKAGIKIADDPYNWNPTDAGTTLPGINNTYGGSPYVYTLKDGTIVAGTGSLSEVFVNAEKDGSGDWTAKETGAPAGYNRCFIQLSTGEFLISGTEGDGFATQNNKIYVKRVWAAELPYVDVEKDDWFYDAVYYNYFAGTMTGLDPTHFGPDQSLARAQFAVILYRMNDTPEVEYEAIFPDVEEEVWYTDAVLWAADTGVVTGYTDTGKFGPSDLINREQMAVMMYRYANYKGYESDAPADISGYKDAGKVSAFAEEAMEWAVGNGIISGKDEGTVLDPQGNATRAECATIIMRFIEKFEK